MTTPSVLPNDSAVAHHGPVLPPTYEDACKGGSANNTLSPSSEEVGPPPPPYSSLTPEAAAERKISDTPQKEELTCCSFSCGVAFASEQDEWAPLFTPLFVHSATTAAVDQVCHQVRKRAALLLKHAEPAPVLLVVDDRLPRQIMDRVRHHFPAQHERHYTDVVVIRCASPAAIRREFGKGVAPDAPVRNAQALEVWRAYESSWFDQYSRT